MKFPTKYSKTTFGKKCPFAGRFVWQTMCFTLLIILGISAFYILLTTPVHLVAILAIFLAEKWSIRVTNTLLWFWENNWHIHWKCTLCNILDQLTAYNTIWAIILINEINHDNDWQPLFSFLDQFFNKLSRIILNYLINS